MRQWPTRSAPSPAAAVGQYGRGCGRHAGVQTGIPPHARAAQLRRRCWYTRQSSIPRPSRSWVAGDQAAPMEPKPGPTDTTDAGWPTYGPKATAHLKRSFEYCATALANLDDSKLDEQVPWFGGPNAKATRASRPDRAPDGLARPLCPASSMYLRLNGIPSAVREAETKNLIRDRRVGSPRPCPPSARFRPW